jgi:hypothetical protein
MIIPKQVGVKPEDPLFTFSGTRNNGWKSTAEVHWVTGVHITFGCLWIKNICNKLDVFWALSIILLQSKTNRCTVHVQHQWVLEIGNIANKTM